MTNVLKHSEANRCKVLVDFLEHGVNINVEDNGEGITEKPDHKPGIGMASIRSNIKLLGGTVEVPSKKGKGTAVTVLISWPKVVN